MLKLQSVTEQVGISEPEGPERFRALSNTGDFTFGPILLWDTLSSLTIGFLSGIPNLAGAHSHKTRK